MKEQNTAKLYDGRREKRQDTIARSKRIFALVMAVVALFSMALPQITYTFGTVGFTMDGLSILTTNLSIDGTVIPIPFAMRLAVLLVPIAAAAGIVALFGFKKPVAAGGFFALGVLGMLLQLIVSADLGKVIYDTMNYFERDMQQGIGFTIAFLSCLLACLFSIWSKGGDRLAEALFQAAAMVAVGSVALITLYMIVMGTPALSEIGLGKFLFGTEWSPKDGEGAKYGIFYMILASIFGTGGAILIGVPIGILTAVFLAELAPKWMVNIVRPAIELLAGIPSVVYGFFGMVVVVKLIGGIFPQVGSGEGLLAVILVLSIMVLPTIVNVTETSMRAVPSAYREASLALGETKIGTIFKIVIPAAKSGVLAGVVLGVGRAIGETMAVTMVAGNVVDRFPNLLGPVRPMTVGIMFEMSYSAAGSLHRKALFAIGLVLFAFIMLVNITFSVISKQGVKIDGKE